MASLQSHPGCDCAALAGEVARLREQVLELGEALTALTEQERSSTTRVEAFSHAVLREMGIAVITPRPPSRPLPAGAHTRALYLVGSGD